MSTANSNKSQWPHFRPIAPSLSTAPAVVSHPLLNVTLTDDHEKRKWEDLVNPSMANLKIREPSTDTDGIYGGQYALFPGGPNDASGHILTTEQKMRRKEQNRSAQRAFRERKERYVKELETKIKFMEETHFASMQAVQGENTELRDVIRKMETELLSIKVAVNEYNQNLNVLRQEQGVHVPTFIMPDIKLYNDSVEDDDTMSTCTGVNGATTATMTNGDSDEDGDDDVVKENDQYQQYLQPAAKRIMRVPSSAVACIRDKDGVSFCERLKEEVCSSAYNQLLSEPLFDSAGFLMNDLIKHPVPIVTEDIEMRHDFDRFLRSMNDGVVIDPAKHASKLVPCNEVWQRLSEHPRFERFDLTMLCDELKKCAKCSHDGPVLEEHELNQVIQKMEASLEP